MSTVEPVNQDPKYPLTWKIMAPLVGPPKVTLIQRVLLYYGIMYHFPTGMAIEDVTSAKYVYDLSKQHSS